MAHRGLHMNITATSTLLNERLDPSHRADLLLAELTTAEKCHQLTARMPWSVLNVDGSAAADADQVLRNPPGHIAQLIMDDAATLAAKVGIIQSRIMAASRLSIPALFHAE